MPTGSVNLDRSGCSSSNSGDDSRRELSQSRAISPWNCSGSFSEQSEGEESAAELTVTNLPPFDPLVIQVRRSNTPSRSQEFISGMGELN